jgi:hypothetical protein
LSEDLLQSLGQLVGTRRRLSATANATQTPYDILSLHPLDQPSNTLSIAVAATDKLYRLDDTTVVDNDFDGTRTSADSLIRIFHNKFMYIKQ